MKNRQQELQIDIENSEFLQIKTANTVKDITLPENDKNLLAENSVQDQMSTEEMQQGVDSEKAELEKKYSVPVQSITEVVDQERKEKIACIEKLYAESMLFLKQGEKGMAIAKLQEGIALDEDYYLSWFGLLQVHTDNLKNLQNLEELSIEYDRGLLAMEDDQKRERLEQYAPYLQEKIAKYTTSYKKLEEKDIQLRAEYQPKYNMAWQKCKPMFWTSCIGMLFFIVAMACVWPFLHSISSDWIAYLAVALTVLAGAFFILFCIYAVQFIYLYSKKNFCARLGNSIYGEQMRKLATEREKCQIILEDLTAKKEE